MCKNSKVYFTGQYQTSFKPNLFKCHLALHTPSHATWRGRKRTSPRDYFASVLIWKTLLCSLTFAFGICLDAKPNIRTPSVHCIGKSLRIGYRFIEWNCILTKSCHFSWAAPFLAYLLLFPGSTLFWQYDIRLARGFANVPRVNLEKLQLKNRKITQTSSTELLTQWVTETRSLQTNRILNFIHWMNFGLWSPKQLILATTNQSLARTIIERSVSLNVSTTIKKSHHDSYGICATTNIIFLVS